MNGLERVFVVGSHTIRNIEEPDGDSKSLVKMLILWLIFACPSVPPTVGQREKCDNEGEEFPTPRDFKCFQCICRVSYNNRGDNFWCHYYFSARTITIIWPSMSKNREYSRSCPTMLFIIVLWNCVAQRFTIYETCTSGSKKSLILAQELRSESFCCWPLLFFVVRLCSRAE